MKLFLFKFSLYVFFTLVFSCFLVDSVKAFGSDYGWIMSGATWSAETGCGASQYKKVLLVKDTITKNNISVNNVRLRLFNKISKNIELEINSPGPTVGPFCFNDMTQGYSVYVSGDSYYNNFEVSLVASQPGIDNGAFLITDYVFLTKKTDGKDYESTSPLDYSTTNNSTIQFKKLINYSPYPGAQVDSAYIAIYKWAGGWNFVEVLSSVLGGGLGERVFATKSLSDGIYLYYGVFNLDLFYGDPISTHWARYIHSSYSDYYTFWVDTVAPTFDPVSTVDPNVTATAHDPLANMQKIEVYVDGIFIKKCDFVAYPSAGSCAFDSSVYPVGAVHSYTFKAFDWAGNTSEINGNFGSNPINGSCGTRSDNFSPLMEPPYSDVVTAWPALTTTSWCASGTPSFPNNGGNPPNFPNLGSSTEYWSCLGLYTGTSVSDCQATHPSSFIDIGLKMRESGATVSIAIENNCDNTKPLRIARGGLVYCVALVDPTDLNATNFKIQTSSGIKSLRKFIPE